MPITDQQRDDALQDFARKLYRETNATANLNTDDIKAAVISLVTFIENNAVAVNNAIPEPARSNATNQEKRYLLALAAIKLAGL